MNVSQALISVSDKRGVLDFARELSALGINRNTLRRKHTDYELL